MELIYIFFSSTSLSFFSLFFRTSSQPVYFDFQLWFSCFDVGIGREKLLHSCCWLLKLKHKTLCQHSLLFAQPLHLHADRILGFSASLIEWGAVKMSFMFSLLDIRVKLGKKLYDEETRRVCDRKGSKIKVSPTVRVQWTLRRGLDLLRITLFGGRNEQVDIMNGK